MKHTFTILLIFCLGYSVIYAQTESTKTNQGVQFFEGTWSELLADAKARKKPFFVDVFTTWCQPCKMMSKLTFTDSEVGKISKMYYLAYKIDAERGEGVEVAEKYKVKSYPTVLFFNAEGKLIGRETGYMDQEHFLYVLEKYLKKMY
ncbi:MAG: thioredoxin fold domain-containing protein [Microscillaceae bacterium]|jgi:thiol:disulfide interchange protein|nr:thioredoxin fold domain-containing protein [Microscillaceae bacterium]